MLPATCSTDLLPWFAAIVLIYLRYTLYICLGYAPFFAATDKTLLLSQPKHPALRTMLISSSPPSSSATTQALDTIFIFWYSLIFIFTTFMFLILFITFPSWTILTVIQFQACTPSPFFITCFCNKNVVWSIGLTTRLELIYHMYSIYQHLVNEGKIRLNTSLLKYIIVLTLRIDCFDITPTL